MNLSLISRNVSEHFLPGIDTQHRYAAGSGLAAQGSDQPELPVAFMWIDVTGTQRLRSVQRTASSVGLPALRASSTSSTTSPSPGWRWVTWRRPPPGRRMRLAPPRGRCGGVILVAHGLQLADPRIDRSPAHPQHSRHIRETAKADLQHLDRGVAASLLFRQRTQVDMKSSCD